MSLFSIKDLKTTKTNSQKGKGLATAVGEALYLPILAKKELEEALSEVCMGKTIHYVSDGAWSMHELLAFLLKITRTAKVYIVTWTITEIPARSLLMMKQDGLIGHLSCIIDDRVRTRTPKSYQLLEQTCDRLLEKKCHSKNIVILNDNWQISVVATANFSKNPRIESGVITFDKETTIFHQRWIENIINDEL